MFAAERNELLTRVGRHAFVPIDDVPRELSLPDAVAMAQKDPAKTVPAA
jgi:hypothetical protein